MPTHIIRATLCGSFRKDKSGLYRAYDELVTCGCQVLSPHRLDFDSDQALFVKDTAEIAISERVIEEHHLLAIRQSDFVWLHAPDGYIGKSGALEIGYALAHGIPVYCRHDPADQTLAFFVEKVTSVYDALTRLSDQEQSGTSTLLQPPQTNHR